MTQESQLVCIEPIDIDPKLSLRDQIELVPPPGWKDVFVKYKSFLKLICNIMEREENKLYYPPNQDIFKIYHLCPLANVKVIILGQSPYPWLNENGVPVATGMAFSGRPGYPIPGSARKIFEELNSQIPYLREHKDGDLTKWAKQGVFLINTQLSYHPNAQHLTHWSGFVVKTITECLTVNPKLVLVLWGDVAQKFVSSNLQKIIPDQSRVLACGHPSERNRANSFSNNGHFIKINQLLEESGHDPIDWDTH